jgi:glycosyltransferase involved in cell wall biosynthesis
MTTRPDRRVALAHDYLNQRGGAERVLATLHEAYPEAPIFTSFVDPERLWPSLRSADIRPTWMQRLPGIRRHFKRYLPLYPLAFRAMDLRGYDVVISSSSGFAHAVRGSRDAFHVCYCHTPPRFLWEYERYVERESLGATAHLLLPGVIRVLRQLDRLAARRPDRYVANSRVVKDRIGRCYGRVARVIPPPVDVERFRVREGSDGFLLVVSRLNSYKRIELAIQACTRLRLPLLVVGEGPYRPVLERLAGPSVQFLGYRRDAELTGLYERCDALIFPGEEDFGISVVEANAAGRPVVAYRAGGALDTVEPGLSGVFFDEPRPDSLAEAILAVRKGKWDRAAIRRHAERYSPDRFTGRLAEILESRTAEPACVPAGFAWER